MEHVNRQSRNPNDLVVAIKYDVEVLGSLNRGIFGKIVYVSARKLNSLFTYVCYRQSFCAIVYLWRHSFRHVEWLTITNKTFTTDGTGTGTKIKLTRRTSLFMWSGSLWLWSLYYKQRSHLASEAVIERIIMWFDAAKLSSVYLQVDGKRRSFGVCPCKLCDLVEWTLYGLCSKTHLNS